MIRALLLTLLSAPVYANTTFGTLANQSVLQSTSGVIGSVSPGNTQGKTNIFTSSSAATAAIGATIVLSSRTVTAGKTFYVQHIDAWGFLSVASTGTAVNMGSLAFGTGAAGSAFANKIGSMTFVGGQTSTLVWKMEFAEPLPIAAAQVITSSVTANTASAVTWITNVVGYEK